MTAGLRVHGTGPLALIEDLGRPGLSGIGVGRSGAADRDSLRRANRALRNEEGAAAVEVLLGGLEVEAVGAALTLCVTGAACPVTVDGRDVGPDSVFTVPEGGRVRLGTPQRGLRSYLAVRGGLEVPAVLGSRSHDVMAGLGPTPLQPGDLLPVGPPPAEYPVVEQVLTRTLDDEVVLRVVRGPRDGWVADAEALVRERWVASEQSNRVGMRLVPGPDESPEERPGAGRGQPGLRHLAPDRQLPSEGTWRGAVQVPPSGEPVVFLADHPVTGGYPVVAVVVDADVDRAAQVRPGQAVRFVWAPASPS